MQVKDGTIASRFSRFEPRKNAVEEINEKFGEKTLLNGKKVLEKELEVYYYDGEPTTEKENVEENEGDEND